jgi:hypothetical protein
VRHADLAAAANVTGYVVDEIAPYTGLDTCKLALQEPGGVHTWELTFQVSRMNLTDGGAPITVGGTQLQQVGYTGGMDCGYSYPIGPPELEWGIELTASNVSPNRPQCDVARDYLNAVAPRLASPPLRSAGDTTTALPLARVDPCSVAARLVPIIANGATVPRDELRAGMDTPYDCFVGMVLNPGTPEAQDILSRVEFTADDTVLEGGTVAGRPADVKQDATDCLATFQASDVQVQGDPGFHPTYEAVRLRGPCDRIDPMIGAALEAVSASPPAGNTAQGAVALGDLNPPPTAEQVGAPFDPCTVAGWEVYPPELQPGPNKLPARAQPEPDSGWAVGCSFNTGPMFSILVWGRPVGAFSADPAARPGSVPVRFGGKAGTEQRGAGDGGEPQCYSAVQLADGVAAMSTTLDAGDPCAANRGVLEQVAAKVP